MTLAVSAESRNDERMAQNIRADRLVVRCVTESCEYFQTERTMHWPYLGNGVFFQPTFVCVCGHAMEPKVLEADSVG